ncbi:MAG TPA: hypothetical protein VIF62_05575 [Labilithrix sp.]|jgi:hypothetical protein
MRTPFALFFLLVGTLASCNKEPPPKPKEEPKTTPVPSDMVLNDFIPTTGGQVNVQIDGGSLEGGLAATDTTGAPPDQPQDTGKLHVTDPGSDPRAVRKYAFVANKTDKRILTMRQAMNTPQGPKEIALAFAVDFTPKQVTPKGAHFEMKIQSVTLPDASGPEKAAAAQQFSIFQGLTASFDVSPQGDIGEMEFHGDERMQNPQAARLAQTVINGLQQFVELILPPWPMAPIGAGAKWESRDDRSEQGLKTSSTRKFTLKDLGDAGGTVTSEILISVPKTAIPQQRPGQPPGTLEVEAKGLYTYQFKFDHISSRVEGTLDTKQTLEMKGQPAVSETGKAKHLLEVAK